MRLGAALPFGDLEGGPLTPTSLATSASTLERIGYESIWVFDAVGRGFMLPDPLMALTVVAGATESVELGTGIMQLPIRNVVEVAHRLFTLELLAPGRVLFGVGPGSTASDFALFGGSYDERFARFDEQWDELRSLVETGALGDRDLGAPSGLVGGPSLMLAGWRGRWVERSARESSGWIASGVYADDDQLADGLARYRDNGGTRAIVTNVQVGEDLEPAIERVNHLAAIGFDDVVVVDMAASAERFEEIRSRVRAS